MTDDIETPAPPADWARQLLAFWFEDHGMDDWYGGGPDFDAAVRDLAESWHEALRSQPAESFLTDPDTALAATILFDQVPRNIYRGHADAFATDDLARAIARGIVAHGWHENWPDERRQFACLPFQHSEDIGDQREHPVRRMAGPARGFELRHRQPTPGFPSCASRAARSLAKSSPAWCEERVSGLEDTSRKPLLLPTVS